MYPVYHYYGYEEKCENTPVAFPPQHQDVQPGIESEMVPQPIFDNPDYVGSGKLKGKIALITGGDSGIGRAVAVAFAKEGADIAIVYLYERSDALETKSYVEKLNQRCLTIEGNLMDEDFCKAAVQKTVDAYGTLDILVNNAGVLFPQASLLDITAEQLERTFRTNVFAMFYLTKAALPHLKAGSSIISTASSTAYQGSENIIDYSSSKGAIVSFTRSLSLNLNPQHIRVNAVAPGPVWTPLIVSSQPAYVVKDTGLEVPFRRAGQPFELAPTYVYLASDDSGYVSGQVLHVNGGGMVES